jgi:hypothetical protein
MVITKHLYFEMLLLFLKCFFIFFIYYLLFLFFSYIFLYYSIMVFLQFYSIYPTSNKSLDQFESIHLQSIGFFILLDLDYGFVH